MTTELPITARTQVRRLADRQSRDRALLLEIVDEALIAHVAAVVDGQPVVLPFAVARDGDCLLLHGSTGAGLLRACSSGHPISVAITHIDGLVVARSAFDNSLNYRSAVVFGVPQPLTGDEKTAALEKLTDHLLPGQVAEVRTSSAKEVSATMVLRLSLDEVSVKVRSAPATAGSDDGEDRSVWAGVVPLALTPRSPVPDPSVPAGVPVPGSVRRAVARLETAGTRIGTLTRAQAQA